MKKTYPLGCIPSDYDPRDYSVAFVDDRPSKLDWPESDMIPEEYGNYDQGEYGTCVAQSLRYGPHRHYDIPFGINFLYGLGRAENSHSPGMSMRTANDFFVKYGLAPFSADPKEYEMPTARRKAEENKAALLAAAALYKGWAYARLYTMDEIKAAIRDRRHITFRMEVSRNGLDKANFFRGDGKNGVGHHAMVIVGYGLQVNAKGKTVEAVVVRNSWGEDWSVSGDCYMTWEDVLAKNEIYGWFPPADADPTPKPIITPRRTLRKGMSGADVKEAQDRLNAHGFWPATVEAKGNFGSTTKKYTLLFQKAKGLVADAIIGAKTWAALDAEPAIDPPDEFIEYLKARIGDIYVWGAQGQSDITEKWIRSRETSTVNADKAIKLWKDRVKYAKEDLRAFDCSGLIMYYLQNLKGIYKNDMSANSLYSKCKKIKVDELAPRDLVFRHNGIKAYHVGVYIGDGKVIEAKGRDEGVVMGDIGTGWNRYGRLGV